MARKSVSARKSSPRTVYVVSRLGWRVSIYGDRGYFSRHEDDRGVPVAAFASRDSANALCRVLEEEARREVTPFQFEDALECMTSLDQETLCARLADLGLPPPSARQFPLDGEGKYVNWDAWWDHVAGGATDEQRAGVWALLDRIAFYEVVEAELEPRL
jgi:hypothetical protein